MNNYNKIVLKKIERETVVIAEMIAGYNYDDFLKDEKTKRAVCMALNNIGELVKILTDEMKRTNAIIPWRSSWAS
jgi:uncharacterized protein with HEPN domain